MWEAAPERDAVIPPDLEIYLHDHIPLSKAMGVEVRKADWDSVELIAPLAPNINHRETVFGGSASAVAILCAWSLVHVRLTEEGIRSRLVIRRNVMRYEQPCTSTFVAISVAPNAADWTRFVRTLQRKKRARVVIAATLHCGGDKVGELEGEFVALGTQLA